MKKNLSMKSSIKKCLSVLCFAILLLTSKHTQAQCVGVVVTPPVIDVRGSTNLCSGTLQLCPLVWGFSNYQWYLDGVAYSTNSCIDVTVAGSYTVAGQDGGGCWSDPSTAVVATGGFAPTVPTISAGSATTFCNGGSVVLSSDALTGNQWYKDGVIIGGATSSTYTATTSGDYTVTVTDCGASSTSAFSITVTVNASPVVAAIAGSNAMCIGDITTLTNATAGGVWSSNNTSVVNISAGGVDTSLSAGVATINYAVTSGGCTTTATYNVTVSSAATPTIDVRGSTVLCSSSTVDLCPTSYLYTSYQWYKNGVAYSTATCTTVSTVGSYTLVGQNGGCTSAASTAVVVTAGIAPATPTISTITATTFCSGGNVILTSSAAANNQWYKDAVAIGGATNQTYTATTSGSYTVVVANCGTATSAATVVTVNSSPVVAAITGAATICVGTTAALANDSAGGVWSSSNTLVATISGGGVDTGKTVGTTEIRYTVTSAGCSTIATYNVSVVANTTPSISVTTGSAIICGSATTTICPATFGNSAYQWFKDGVAFATTSCITVSAIGSYTLQVQNNAGCWSAISNAIAITAGIAPTTPTVTAGGVVSFCDGGSVVLTSSVAANYQWNKDGIAIGGATSQTYSATASGIYTVSVSGCGTSTSAGTTVTVTTAPIVDLITGATTLCAGTTITLANATVGGTWSSSNTLVATVDAAGIVTGVSGGNITISYTVTSGGCSTVKTYNVTVYPTVTTPTISPRSATTFCTGGSVQMCPLSFGYSNYQWYKDGVAYATTSCIITSVAGSYTLAGQSGGGCWSSQSAAVVVTVGVYPIVNATTGPTSVCVGSSITVANTTVTPIGGTAVWTSTAGRASVNSAGLVTGTSAGAANIRYTVSSAEGCATAANYAVTVNALPAVPSMAYASGYSNPTGPGGYCANRIFGITGSPSGGVFSSTGVISISVVPPPVCVVTTGAVAGAGTLKYTYTNANGCSNSRTVNIPVVICVPRGVVVSNNTIANDFIIYPNPAKSMISLNIKYLVGAGSVIITNVLGQKVKTQPLSLGINTIDVSNLSKGMYLVSVVTSEGKKTEKLVVE